MTTSRAVGPCSCTSSSSTYSTPNVLCSPTTEPLAQNAVAHTSQPRHPPSRATNSSPGNLGGDPRSPPRRSTFSASSLQLVRDSLNAMDFFFHPAIITTNLRTQLFFVTGYILIENQVSERPNTYC